MKQIHYVQQRGAALITALIVLLAMTLIAIQLTTQGGINKVLVQNEESRAQTEQIAQNVANLILSDIDHFLTTSTASSKIAATFTDTSYTITTNLPECVQVTPVPGYSLQALIVPNAYYWEFDVTVVDNLTNAKTKLEVGAKFNYTAGNCPAV